MSLARSSQSAIRKVGLIFISYSADDSEQYFSAWIAGLGPNKLLCTWHVDCAWRKAVNSIKVQEIAAIVYHNVQVWMEEIDPSAWTAIFGFGPKK